MSSKVKNGHEYIRVFRTVEPRKNQQCILQDNGYYYYSDYHDWKNHTMFHLGDIVFFNHGLICNDPISDVGIGTLGMIIDKQLKFDKNIKGTWEKIMLKDCPMEEYSDNNFEVCYQIIKVDGDLTNFDSINCLTTLDNAKEYFHTLLECKKEIESYNIKIKEIQDKREELYKNLADFKVCDAYNMLYVQPYKGDEEA